ncbi:hypothetical protein [uncultured Dysosmobacter sp.]|uniref:hypothetical protein n=1 Tax=uncultured Dysosmobacter sp. TaxID=2591384 RepID=UPI00263484A0|nr:hypothetical protein [uncultured Dysosmobacter sp.]
MDEFETSKRRLLALLTANIEQETIDYVHQEMRQAAPEIVPTASELRAFFQSLDGQTELSAYQQVLAMDKLLEYAEVSLRTLCDLIRYQQLKQFGIVHSVEEFAELFHPDEQEDQK